MTRWMIISWKHIDHADTAYGELMETVEGTREGAEAIAREWVPQHSPIGIVQEIV